MNFRDGSYVDAAVNRVHKMFGVLHHRVVFHFKFELHFLENPQSVRNHLTAGIRLHDVHVFLHRLAGRQLFHYRFEIRVESVPKFVRFHRAALLNPSALYTRKKLYCKTLTSSSVVVLLNSESSEQCIDFKMMFVLFFEFFSVRS